MSKQNTNKVIESLFNQQTIMSVIQLLGLVADENGMYSLSSLMGRFHKKLSDKVMFKVYVWIDNYLRSPFDDDKANHGGRTEGECYKFVYGEDEGLFDYYCDIYAPGIPVDILLDGNAVCQLLTMPNDFLHLTSCKKGYSEDNKKLIEDVRAYLYASVFNNNSKGQCEHYCADSLYHGSMNDYVDVRKILRLIMDNYNWHDYIVDDSGVYKTHYKLEYYIGIYDTYKELVKRKRKFDNENYRRAYNKMNSGVIISKANIYG